MGKTFESTIFDRLLAAVEGKNITCNKQFRFRARHSTTDKVFTLVEYVTEDFSFKESTGSVFPDMSKAFNKICQAVKYQRLNRIRPRPSNVIVPKRQTISCEARRHKVHGA